MTRLRIQGLGDATTLVLHRLYATVQALGRLLSAIGLRHEAHWPDLPVSASEAGFVFFDLDLGHDAQFPGCLTLRPCRRPP